MHTHPEFNRCREVVKVAAALLLDDFTALLVGREVDEGGRDDALLALDGTDELLREVRTSVRHGERCGAGAILGLDDLVTAELDAVRQLLVVLLGEAHGERVRRLREERHDLDEGSQCALSDWTG